MCVATFGVNRMKILIIDVQKSSVPVNHRSERNLKDRTFLDIYMAFFFKAGAAQQGIGTNLARFHARLVKGINVEQLAGEGGGQFQEIDHGRNSVWLVAQ